MYSAITFLLTLTVRVLMVLHCESKNWTFFSFEHNFGKYCPILIILSRLQTEINCDQAHPKIYHYTVPQNC